MRVVVTSDTHNQEFEFPAGEFFIHCGDMTNGGSLAEVAAFAARLNGSEYEGGVIVPGNHDRLFETMWGTAAGLFDARFQCLWDEVTEYRGLSIWGSPWTLPYGEYAFMRREERLRRVYSGIPRSLDVLVTHGPAYGVLDLSGDGEHLGSHNLEVARVRRSIRHHFFGHIHRPGGQVVHRSCGSSYNVAATDIVDGRYVLARAPLVMDL